MKIARGLLAAGQSERFGTLKQLINFSDTTLIQKAVQALTTDCDLPYVVLGEQAGEIQESIKAQFIFNPHFKQGMGTSIAALAKEILPKNYDALVIHLCDLPLVTQKDISELIQEYLKNPHTPVASQFLDSIAPPCVVPKNLFDELSKLQEDRGAKSILSKHNTRVFSMPAAAHDVDTQEDLERIIGLQLALNKG